LVALHVLSAFMTPIEAEAKEKAITQAGGRSWRWSTVGQMPDLPEAQARLASKIASDAGEPRPRNSIVRK